MVVLMVFAFVAGAATALSPCVLPVLPVVLSAGLTGGRRRPFGIVTGLALSFAFATVALVYVIDGFGLPDDLLRNIAIAVLLGFGITLLAPPVAARVEAWISKWFPRAYNARADGGFGSGLLVGASLGFVYAPCAGPILAGVITVSASQEFTAGRLAVALAYAAGSALVLYLLLLGGRRLIPRLSRHAGAFQTGVGALMVAVAVLMFADYDTRFQTAIADDLPAVLVNPSGDLEDTAGVREELAELRGGGSGGLPKLGPAPDFTGTQRWFNTAGGRRLSLAGLRGKVVLVDFWTYTCINCIRTLPYLKAWDKRYRARGLVIVGVHTPEFPFERDAGNVSEAIDQNGLRYPVAQDNGYATWDAYGNQYWPAKYLIDARGRVRYTHFGEGAYGETESAIRRLLEDAGHRPPPGLAQARAESASPLVTTPESYLGAARAERFVSGSIRAGTRTFPVPADVPDDHLAFEGRWRVGESSATAERGARLHIAFGAQRAFLVLGTRTGRPRRVRVLLDGHALPDELAGADVHSGTLEVDRQRLYRLVELPRAERHLLTLELPRGVEGYAFTFG